MIIKLNVYIYVFGTRMPLDRTINGDVLSIEKQSVTILVFVIVVVFLIIVLVAVELIFGGQELV